MSYLEELLPEFRKGAKIRNKNWKPGDYYKLKNGQIINQDKEKVIRFFSEAVLTDQWELYEEPIDWQYIIDHKCLCWFWDDDDTDGVMAILVSVYKDSLYRYYCRDLAGRGSSRKHFRPVRKDEATFYEDKK